ncbi:MAG TPA: threonine/serine dehydratase [Blastocatellia bacterium]|nr:threonine/serine dehydratase [Blastocatellia bacterium]
MVTLERIEAASWRIAGVARRTPLEQSRWLSADLTDGPEVLLKLECFQVTGSFKIRGAVSKLTSLSEEEQTQGVLTVSAGNHGLAVAHSAELLGIEATIVVPETASPAKVAAIRRYPVTLIERGANYDEAERAAREMELQGNKVFVSPYNDEEVIAGQGTIAIEILNEDPDIDTLVVPVGGGGLIAGIAIAAKAINPAIRIYGVEPEASPTMTRALEAGEIVRIEEDETIADGLAGNIEPGSMTFPIIRDLVDDILLVSEAEIYRSIARIAREDHLIVEGSAAAAIAPLSNGQRPAITGSRIAAIITGRNIALDLFCEALGESPL